MLRLPVKNKGQPPAINLPPVVTGVLAVFVVVHVLLRYVLDVETAEPWLYAMALFSGALTQEQIPYVPYITYGLVHLDTLHLAMNSLWLAVFGTPLARLLGAGRLLALLFAGFVLGGVVFMMINSGQAHYLIGASAGVTALMGAMVRYGFVEAQQGYNALRPWRSVARDKGALVFVGLWLFTELLFNAVSLGPVEQPVAWEAHIAGFVAGVAMLEALWLLARRRV